MKKLIIILLAITVLIIDTAGSPVSRRFMTESGLPKNTMALKHVRRNNVTREYVLENFIQDRGSFYCLEDDDTKYAVSDTIRHNDSEYVILFVNSCVDYQAYLCVLNGRKYPRMLCIYIQANHHETTFSILGNEDEIEICTVFYGIEFPQILQRIYSLDDSLDLICSNYEVSDAVKLIDYEEEVLLNGKVRFEDYPVMESLPDSIGEDFPVSKYKKIFFEDARKNLIQIQNKSVPQYPHLPNIDNLYFGLGRYIINGNTYFVLLNIRNPYAYELYLATIPESQNYPELLMIWSNYRRCVDYRIIDDRIIELTLNTDMPPKNRRIMRFNLDSRLSRIE